MKATDLLTSQPTPEQYAAAIKHAVTIPRIAKYMPTMAETLLATLLELYMISSKKTSSSKRRTHTTHSVKSKTSVNDLNTNNNATINDDIHGKSSTDTSKVCSNACPKSTKPTLPIVQDSVSQYKGDLASIRVLSKNTCKTYIAATKQNLDCVEPKAMYKYCTIRECGRCRAIFKYALLTKCSHGNGKCNEVGLYPHLPRCTWKRLHGLEPKAFPKLVCFARCYANPLSESTTNVPAPADDNRDVSEEMETTQSLSGRCAPMRTSVKRHVDDSALSLHALRKSNGNQLVYCCPCGRKLRKNARGNRNCSESGCKIWANYKLERTGRS